MDVPTIAPFIYGAEFIQSASYKTFRPEGRADWLLIYTLEGAGLISNVSMHFLAEPGSLLLYEPGAYQDYRTASLPGNWRFLWVHFQPQAGTERQVVWPEWSAGVKCMKVPEARRRLEIEEAFHRMLRYSRYQGEQAGELPFLALEEIFTLSQLGDEERALCADPRVWQAMNYLREHYREPFSLAEVAKRAGLSRSRFSAVFHTHTGQTPHEFHEEERMNHAVSLLEFTQLSVAEVARACGFDDAFYFSKRFRKWKGRPPSAYRTA